MPLSCNPENKPNYIKIIYNKINNIEKIKTKGREGELFTKLEKFHENSQDGITTIKYIFLGHCNPDILTKLRKIEVARNTAGREADEADLYGEAEGEELWKYFNYEDLGQMRYDWGITKTNKIHFIPFYIAKDEKVGWLFNILGTWLNLDGDEIFKKEYLYIYSKRVVTDEDVGNVVNNIKKKYINNVSEFTFPVLTKHLKQFLIPKDKIDELIGGKTEGDIYSILDNSDVAQYIRSYLEFKPIGYEYIIDDYSYPVNSYIYSWVDSELNDIDFTLPNVYLKNNDQYLINYFLPEEEDTFYLYNFWNLAKMDFFKERPQVDMYKHVIKKLFPQLNENCLLDPIIKDPDAVIEAHNEQIEQGKKLLENYNNLFYAYNTYINRYLNEPILKSDPQIEFELENEYLFILKRKFHIPSNFDFKHIFNNLKLDEDIPFVKFKDVQGTREIVYKLFKPISHKKTYKYEPLISKDTIDSWVRYKGYEMVDQTLNKLKLLPKEICYKIKIDTIRNQQKFSGTIFTVYDDDSTYDIEYSIGEKQPSKLIPRVPKHCIDGALTPGSLAVGTDVKFYKPIYIYGDLELSNKGYMKLTLDIEQYNQLFSDSKCELRSDCLKKINSTLNKFIERVCATDVLAKYKPFNLYSDELLLNNLKVATNFNNYSIDNIIYKYSVKLPESITVAYEYLYKAADMLHPFVFINENPYNIGDPIQYYEIEQSAWINGIVKAYSIDNTFSVALYDEDMNETSNRVINDIKSIFIRRKHSQSHIFDIIYKRVNEFDTTSPIINIIKKLLNIGLGNGDILNKLVNTYNINHDYALEMIKQVGRLSGDSMELEKISKGTGISIKIDYNKRVYNSGENIDIYLENVTSENDINNIYNFLNFYFSLYLRIVVHDNIEPGANREIFNYIIPDEFDINTTKLKTQAVEISKLTKSPVNTGIHGTMDVGYLSSDDDLDDDWSDDDEEEAVDEPAADTPIIIKNISDKKLKQEMLVNIESDRPEKNKILRNLYEKDPILFNWKLSTDDVNKGYPRAQGGADRYPKVITDEEKGKIDKKDRARCLNKDIRGRFRGEFRKCPDQEQRKLCEDDLKHCKSSYQTIPTYIRKGKKDPLLTTEILGCEEGLDGVEGDKCNAIKWGSGDKDSYHWYICPKIIELNTNMTLTVDELEGQNDAVEPPLKMEKFVSKYDYDLMHKEDGEANIAEWRIDNKTGRDILEFNPSYEGHYQIPDGWKSDKMTTRNSLWFLSEKEGALRRSYPGFFDAGKHPLNISTPTCFKAGRGRIKQVLGKSKGARTAPESKYIQSWGNSLNEGRLGLLPSKLSKQLNKMICKTGDRSIIETECFIRAGVSNNSIKDNFLDLLVYYNKHSRGSNYKTVDSIKHHILTTLDEEKFNKLNNGNLAIQFKNKGITEPFQNYLEYVISSQHKYLEYFYDFLTSPSGIFGEEGFKLLIVEYSEHRGGETEKLKCFDFLKADKIKEGDKIGICMYHKQPQQDYGIYEIIGLYKKDDETLRYDVSGEEGHEKVQLHGPPKSDTNRYINQLIKYYNEQCTKEEPSNLIAQAGDGMNIINTKIDIADIDTAIELAEYSIKHYIKDTYNKITAIAVHRAAKKPARGEEAAEGERELFMIPVYPQNQHLPHLPWQLSSIFYKSLSPENIPTQAAWDEVMKEVNDKLNGILGDKLNQNVFNTYIKPIHTVKKGDENIGIIIASGHYIKLKEINHPPPSNTSIEPYKIDTRIWEREKEIDKKSYKTALTIQQITDIIGEEAEVTEVKSLLPAPQTVALKYEGIYIPVHTRSEQPEEDNTLPDEEVEDYNKYIADAIRVNQQHKYKLHCLPVRGYMKDGDVHGANPKYTHIILETGLKVKLKQAFSISEKDDGEEDKYKIERIIEEPIIEQIFGNIIPDYDSIYSSRSINNDKINYKGDINKILKLELYLLMQKPEFSTIKQILLDILDCRYYSKFTKKIFIWPVMNYILDLIIQPVDKKAGDKYPKLDIENSCNNTVIENDYCTEKTTPSEMGGVIGELEYIEEAFSLCHKVKDVEGEEDVKEMADAKRKNISEIKQQSEAFEKIRGEYNTFRSRAVGLKLKKLKILQPLGNNFIDQLKSDIINNIIYNKYRREQIFTQYTNTDISNKYKVHEPYEHLISHYDYNISVLEALYKFKRQQYYNENIPFDLVEYNQELNYNISKTKQTGTRTHFKEETYQWLSKTIKYTIKGEIENYGDNIKKLDEGSVSKLYNLLYSEQFHPGLLEKCERPNSTPERKDFKSMDNYITLKLK